MNDLRVGMEVEWASAGRKRRGVLASLPWGEGGRWVYVDTRKKTTPRVKVDRIACGLKVVEEVRS